MSRMPPIAMGSWKVRPNILDYSEVELPLIPIGLRPYCRDGCAAIPPGEVDAWSFTAQCQFSSKIIIELFAEEECGTFMNVSRGDYAISLDCHAKDRALECSGFVPSSGDKYLIEIYSSGWIAVYRTEVYCGDSPELSSASGIAFLVICAIALISFTVDVFCRRH